MGVPVSQMWTVASYVLRQKLRGRKRYPLVLMLEPLFRCNLACAGCGKIQYPAHILKKQLTPEQCFEAVDECGAPMVSIPGGEPLLHPQIKEIVEGLVARKKYIYLCTNALLLKEKIDLFTPSKYLTFSVHMDGQQEHHDFAVCREGDVRRRRRRHPRSGEARLPRHDQHDALRRRRPQERPRVLRRDDGPRRRGHDALARLQLRQGPRPEALPRQGPHEAPVHRSCSATASKGWAFNQSPLFLEFLMGKRHYACTPWGMPTYNIFGWQKPCYLLQDGYADTFEELIEATEWERYGTESGNPKCANCMVHSGYEASAVNDTFGSIKGLLATARATLFGGRYADPEALEALDEKQRPASLVQLTVSAPTRDPHGRPGAGSQPCLRRSDTACKPVHECRRKPSPTHRPSKPSSPRRRARTARRLGARISPSEADLRAALDKAFDYRGDVTITLQDGTSVEGYVFDRRAGEPLADSVVRLIPRTATRS